ncbi:hypothetical protein B0H11DRAFT_1898438 [Mycena galericulata]|nr:hypothetical protein B0H11DRAFT_1898438 [Mycena galericulata]
MQDPMATSCQQMSTLYFARIEFLSPPQLPTKSADENLPPTVVIYGRGKFGKPAPINLLLSLVAFCLPVTRLAESSIHRWTVLLIASGNLTQFNDPDDWALQAELEQNYAKVAGSSGSPKFSFNTTFDRQLFVFDSAALNSILVQDQHSYEGTEDLIMHISLDPLLLGKGIFSSARDGHRKYRKTMIPAFSTANLRPMIPLFYEVAEKTRDGQWTHCPTRCSSSTDGVEGDDISPPSFLRFMINFIPVVSLHKLRDLVDLADATATELVRERKAAIASDRLDANDEHEDIMSLLVKGNMSPNNGIHLTDDELVACTSLLSSVPIQLTIIFAATDTTSSALHRVFHILAMYLDVQEKLRVEILSFPEHLDHDTLVALPFLRLAVTVSRWGRAQDLATWSNAQYTVTRPHLRPLVDTVLPLTEPITSVDGGVMHSITVPKGTSIYLAIAAANHDKEIWGEDALEFKPERWTNGKANSVTTKLCGIPAVVSDMLSLKQRSSYAFYFAVSSSPRQTLILSGGSRGPFLGRIWIISLRSPSLWNTEAILRYMTSQFLARKLTRENSLGQDFQGNSFEVHVPTVAKSAAHGSSRGDLLTLFLEFPKMSREHMALTLPVLFLYLDPAGIPTSQELDGILCAPAERVKRLPELHTLREATIAVKGVAALAYKALVPPDAFPEIWPRLYLWITFLHTYWDVIPAQMAFNETEAYCVYSCIILAIAQHPRTSALIQGVPGPRTILVRWWAILLDNDGVVPDEAHMPQPDGWLDICGILVVLGTDLVDTRNLEEILDEAGGKQAMSFLLHKHIDIALARPPSPGRTETIARAIQFIYLMEDDEGLLDTVLLSHGFVGTLVKAIPVLWAGEIGHKLSEMGLMSVYQCFQHPKSDPWIIQALQAGLLGVMISLGTSGKERPLGVGNVHIVLEDLLQQILPGSLIYYRVACQMKISFPAARYLASAPAFRESAIYQSWKSFETFLERRLAGLDYFESGGWISSKACENIQASKHIHLTFGTDVKVVPENGRKVAIPEMRRVRRSVLLFERVSKGRLEQWTSWYPSGTLSPRERSFIRAFMEHDFRFAGLAAQVVMFQLQFIYKNPGVEFFTVFDYSRPAFRGWIRVLPLSAYDMVPNAPVRVARGPARRGCLQEHIVMGEGGRTPWTMLFQRWTSSSKLRDILALIAGHIPPGCDFQEVYKLVAPKVPELLAQLNGDPAWREVY